MSDQACHGCDKWVSPAEYGGSLLCPSCLDTARSRDQATALNIALDALRQLASEDWRGPTPDSVVKARNALARIADLHVPATANSTPSPSVTDSARTYGAVTGGNGRYVLPCGCVPPCEGHHEDES